jgi:hypothetical protein
MHDAFTSGIDEVDVLVTGVGMVATATWCAHARCREVAIRPAPSTSASAAASIPRCRQVPAVHVVSDRVGAELGCRGRRCAFLSITSCNFLGRERAAIRRSADWSTWPPPAIAGALTSFRCDRDHCEHRASAREPSIACVD